VFHKKEKDRQCPLLSRRWRLFAWSRGAWRGFSATLAGTDPRRDRRPSRFACRGWRPDSFEDATVRWQVCM